MTRPPFPIIPLHQLQPGQTGQTFALLAERILGQTREGRPYYLCRFKDRFRLAAVMIWAESPWFFECDKQWRVGAAYRLLATYSLHDRFGPQLELLNLRPVVAQDRQDGYDLANLAEKSRFDADFLWQEIHAIVDREIEQESVRQLIHSVYARHESALRELPASDARHYPYRGGWLEHTYSLCQICLSLVKHYRNHFSQTATAIDQDLVLAGALLHAIGRVQEFKLDPLGMISEATVPGRLQGHVILGRDIVRHAALEHGSVSLAFLERLEHIILCQNIPGDGHASRTPIIPEALIVQHAQSLDSQLEICLRAISHDQNSGPFTTRDQHLGRKLLKPGDWFEYRAN